MSQLGVFGWIRESVRRSVLLGFSDAVEQLGSGPDAEEALHPQMAAMLRDAATPVLSQAAARPAPRPKHKRLGRSLDQLRQTPPARTNDGTA